MSTFIKQIETLINWQPLYRKHFQTHFYQTIGQISLNLVPWDPIDHKLAMVKVMYWHCLNIT